MKSNELLNDKTFAFAVRIVELHKTISDENKDDFMVTELVRSGTVQGARAREVDYAQTFEEALDALKSAQKELTDARYWLELVLNSVMISEDDFKSIDLDAQEILRLLTKAMLTHKQNLFNDN